jgi:hypothetical protein
MQVLRADKTPPPVQSACAGGLIRLRAHPAGFGAPLPQ